MCCSPGKRARQLTKLLGYARAEQLLLASAAFELAWTTYQSRAGSLCISRSKTTACASPARGRSEKRKKQSVGRSIAPGTAARSGRSEAEAPPRRPLRRTGLRLEKPLPRRVDPMPIEDVAWSMEQLAKQTPLKPVERSGSTTWSCCVWPAASAAAARSRNRAPRRGCRLKGRIEPQRHGDTEKGRKERLPMYTLCIVLATIDPRGEIESNDKRLEGVWMV